MAKTSKPSKPAKRASKPAKKTAKHPAHTHRMPTRPVAKPRKVAAKPRAKAAGKPVARPASAASKPAAEAKAPPTPGNPLAARMAAFSAKVLREEEKPVAVQSFIEARAGKKASKEYLPKTGKVTPAAPTEAGDDFDDEDDDDDGGDLPTPQGRDATGEPRTEPMTGRMSVPRDNETAFEVENDRKSSRPYKKGKKGMRPEEFGLVDLRQATASGGKHLARVRPENLQEKGASKIRAITAEPDAHQKKKAPDRFEVSMDKRSGPKMPDLSDFGEVEIGQQTLSGSRKVGTLTPSEQEAKKRPAKDEKS